MISYEKRALRFSATVLPPFDFLSLLIARHIKPPCVERKPATYDGDLGFRLQGERNRDGTPHFSRPACLSAASIFAAVPSSTVVKGERSTFSILPSRDRAYLAPATPGSMKIAL